MTRPFSKQNITSHISCRIINRKSKCSLCFKRQYLSFCLALQDKTNKQLLCDRLLHSTGYRKTFNNFPSKIMLDERDIKIFSSY